MLKTFLYLYALVLFCVTAVEATESSCAVDNVHWDSNPHQTIEVCLGDEESLLVSLEDDNEDLENEQLVIGIVVGEQKEKTVV